MRRRWLAAGIVSGIAVLLSSMQSRSKESAVTPTVSVPAEVTVEMPASLPPAEIPVRADGELPEVPAQSEQALRDEMNALLHRLEANSTDQMAVDRLSSLHTMGFFKDEIVGFLVGLRRDHPDSYVLTLALADIYVQENNFSDAIALYEKVAPMSDGSLAIDFKLAHARLKSDDPAGALNDARRMRAEVERRVKEKAAGKRTDDGISDALIIMPCMLEAVALAKQDQREASEQAISDCGKGLLTPDQQAQLRASLTYDYELLRDQDIDTILD